MIPSALVREIAQPKARCLTGFSLIELLVVVGVISVLMLIAVPSLNSVMEGGRLSQGALVLVNQFTLAGQIASSTNQNVALRIIREDASSPYDRIQLVTLDASGNATPVGRLAELPAQTAFASNPSLSSLMGISETAASSSNDPPIPGVGTSYRYIECTFRPRGSLDLNIQGNWFVTVAHERHEADSAAPPNFATVQIDPVNGGVRVYRP